MATLDVPTEAPRTRRFTVAEYERLAEVGILGPDEAVELLDGEIVVVSPQGEHHGWCIAIVNRALIEAYPADRYAVRPQLPILAGEYSLPEPDLAVVRGTPVDYLARGGRTRTDEAMLLIEVVVTQQKTAQRKAGIYATAGGEVYWIVDIPTRTVIVHEQPRPDGTWGRITTLGEGEELELPEVGRVGVRDVLPPVAEPDGGKEGGR